MTISQAQQTDCERGSITVFFVVIAIAFFAVVSLVAEGSRRLGNLSRAEDIASEAARAAAATLDPNSVSGGSSFIDLVDDRARKQAEMIVDDIPDAEIERFDISPQRVFVVVRVRGTSFVPGLNIDGVGSHEAFAFDPTS